MYDLTKFLAEHPGGADVIAQFAGKDGSEAFGAVHPSDMIDKMNLGHLCVGKIDTSTAPPRVAAATAHTTPAAAPASNQVVASASGSSAPWRLPPISHNLNVFDLENIASKQMAKPGWDYYSSGADDEITLRENHRLIAREVVPIMSFEDRLMGVYAFASICFVVRLVQCISTPMVAASCAG